VTVHPFIEAEKQSGHSVKRACELLQVSRTAFYARRYGTPGPRAVRDTELTEQITAVHERSRGTYGAPRVHAVLKREGSGCGRRRVARLMRAAGLQGRHRRRRHLTTIPDPRAAIRPDLVDRDFRPDATALDARWCGDITYIPTEEGWLYLATVIDIASRRVVGWATADHLRTELLREEWSPEQIVGHLRLNHGADPGMEISHETIYRSVYTTRWKVIPRELCKRLRTGRPIRKNKRHTVKGQWRSQITDARPIEERPQAAEDRSESGHLEGDLVIGSNNSQVATLVDRKTRFLTVVKLACGAAEMNGPPDFGTQELCPLQEWGCTAALRQPFWHLLSSHSTSDGEAEYCKCGCNAIVVLFQEGVSGHSVLALRCFPSSGWSYWSVRRS
jgi:hypothetical protein